MKCKILLSAALVSASLISTAQDASKAYAITGKEKNNFLWADIKQVDLATGKVIKTLFESDKTPFQATSLDAAKPLHAQDVNPTGFGVAACALDSRHNRLYFAPMHISDITYLDLNKSEATFTTVKRSVITPGSNGYLPEENQITRMVIAADGYGYALTNDANHLIRFTTDKRPVVEDLGNLIDNESNKGISVHNKCTSWGGDMLADAFGKLVIVTASHNIFTVDAATRVATHTGTITGLPLNFTTNGAAVDNDGSMIVSSANVFEGLYKVNMKDFKAVKIESTEKAFNASDLANGNFLSQKEADAASKFDLSKSVLPSYVQAGEAKVFPNPVTTNEFKVLLEGQKQGKYTITLSDLSGRALQSKVITVTGPSQVETIRFANKTAKGMYMVKVVDENKQLAFSEKIVVQ